MNELTDARLIDLARHARAAGEVIVAEAAAQGPFRTSAYLRVRRQPAPYAVGTRIHCER